MSLSARSIADEAPVPGHPGVLSERRGMVERELEAEFGGVLGPGVISRLAAESVERFAGAPVQTFVSILAVRTARRQARIELAQQQLEMTDTEAIDVYGEVG